MTITLLLVLLVYLWVRVDVLTAAAREQPRLWSAEDLDRSFADLERARASTADARATGKIPPKKPGERY